MQFLHNSRVNVSSCLTISQCLSSRTELQQHSLWNAHSRNSDSSPDPTFSLSIRALNRCFSRWWQQKRKCGNVDWDDCSQEQWRWWAGKVSACICHGSNLGLQLNSTDQESPRAKSQTSRGQHRPTWLLSTIWSRAGESSFLTSIPSSVTDMQLFPSRRWNDIP